MSDNSLKVGDIVYILGKYTPDGIIRIVEVEIQETWTTGKGVAHTTGNEPGDWKFHQSHLNKVVFRTREEAEKALRQLNNRVVLMPERMPLSVFVIPKLKK